MIRSIALIHTIELLFSLCCCIHSQRHNHHHCYLHIASLTLGNTLSHSRTHSHSHSLVVLLAHLFVRCHYESHSAFRSLTPLTLVDTDVTPSLSSHTLSHPLSHHHNITPLPHTLVELHCCETIAYYYHQLSRSYRFFDFLHQPQSSLNFFNFTLISLYNITVIYGELIRVNISIIPYYPGTFTITIGLISL